MKLLLDSIVKFLVGLVMCILLVFLPAGSLKFINGWIFVAALFLPMLVLGTVLLVKSPKLLEKRLSSKEKRGAQKGIVALCGALFILGFVLAGLDYRFGLTNMPMWCSITATAVLLVSYAAYAEVMRENAYLSRTIEVKQDQKLVDSGLYGVVRHPMYLATLFMFLSIPVILGSWLALACFAFYPIIIVIRIVDEEKLLKAELEGYTEYTQKVKYRLIPFVW